MVDFYLGVFCTVTMISEISDPETVRIDPVLNWKTRISSTSMIRK